MEKNEKNVDKVVHKVAQTAESTPVPPANTVKPVEIGGPPGPEPTRYGDWERNGRVSDF